MSSFRPATRRLAAALGGTALLAGLVAVVPAAGSALASRTGSGSAATAASPASPAWVASWAASPMAGSSGFTNQTVRNIIYTSVGGDSLRIQVSNTFGSSPVTIGAASAGKVLDGAQLVPGSSQALTFGGKTSATIPAGGQVLSDPLTMTVRPLQELAVSLYLPDATGPATNHSDAQQTSYIASGAHTGDAAADAYTKTTGSWYYLDGLDVRSATAAGTVVAFGDSITDGYQSQSGANARWPNYLARRLDALFGRSAPGVVDEGISGNRVLNDSSCFGVSALARFERDALTQPGVKNVLLLEGINDIGFAGQTDTGCYAPSNLGVSAAQIEAGYRQLINMAHARAVKIYGGTLTPFMGSNPGYGGYDGTAYGESLRQQVNTWIRTSHAFDGVIDFSAATQDPDDPVYLNPPDNSGDSLHPGDVGYEAMARTVPLQFVR